MRKVEWSTLDERFDAEKDYSAALVADLLHLQGMVEDLNARLREREMDAPVAKTLGDSRLWLQSADAAPRPKRCGPLGDCIGTR